MSSRVLSPFVIALDSVRTSRQLPAIADPLSLPNELEQVILEWTNDHPWLTKIIHEQLLQDRMAECPTAIGEAAPWFKDFVDREIRENWEISPAWKPLQMVRDRLLENRHCKPYWLLKIYQQVLAQEEVLATDSAEQRELGKIGLVVVKNGCLHPANRLYAVIFNSDWVGRMMHQLRPYEQFIQQLEPKTEAPYGVLEMVLSLTNRQPFLTALLCQLIADAPDPIPEGAEAVWLKQLVQERLIDQWEQQAAASHLKDLRDRLLNQGNNTRELLSFYQDIINNPGKIADHSWQQQTLLQFGLIDLHDGQLMVYNAIYQAVFNADWIDHALAQLSVAISRPLPSREDGPLGNNRRSSNLSVLGGFIALMLVLGLGLVQGTKMFRMAHHGEELGIATTHDVTAAPSLGQSDALPSFCRNYEANRSEQIAVLRDFQQALEGPLPLPCQQLKDDLLYGQAIETLASNNQQQAAAKMLCEVSASYWPSKPRLVPYFSRWSESNATFGRWLKTYLPAANCPAANYLQ